MPVNYGFLNDKEETVSFEQVELFLKQHGVHNAHILYITQ